MKVKERIFTRFESNRIFKRILSSIYTSMRQWSRIEIEKIEREKRLKNTTWKRIENDERKSRRCQGRKEASMRRKKMIKYDSKIKNSNDSRAKSFQTAIITCPSRGTIKENSRTRRETGHPPSAPPLETHFHWPESNRKRGWWGDGIVGRQDVCDVFIARGRGEGGVTSEEQGRNSGNGES